ncbi:CdaR family protein [Dethiobacter alkaliphilus]|uniref:CdaR family protein n=1 Tax=Dethiobacter alkaliphilus TaxID=427926 RepID=UPI002227C80E|nr:CdaR family protein [Dethiobacter alkaliphilus]MCW3490621.1 CdaR family protein [Dethiobacter alkaliphilus]
MMDRLLKNNTVVKVFAFFLALMLWLYVSGERALPDATLPVRNVPLNYRNLDDQLAIMQIPEEIDVVLRGRPNILQDLTPQSLNVYVDLQDLGEGRHSLTPRAEVPRGVHVSVFNPSQVQVELEEVESPQENVVLEIIGTPDPGFVMGEPRIIPDSVFVRGPRSVLAEVDRVLAIINVDGADDDRVQMVPVRAIDTVGQEVEGVVVNPGMVEVMIPFSEPQKTVPIRVPMDGEPAEGYQVKRTNLQPAEVTIQGPEENIAAIDEIVTERVDIADASDTLTFELSLISPQGVELLYDGPVNAEIEIDQE